MQRVRQSELRQVVLTATRAFVGVAAQSLAEVSDEVSLAQYRVLVLLDGRGPLAMGELASSLDVNPSTVTRVCDVLVAKGLIWRQTSDEGRRGVDAELTAAGRSLVRQAMSKRLELIDGVLTRMSPAGRKQLAMGMVEFASAAGEVGDEAWMLGWSVNGGGK